MARTKKEKMVATTGPNGEPLLMPAKLTVPALPVEVKKAKKVVKKAVKKIALDQQPHTLYLRTNKKVATMVETLGKENKVSANEVAKTILENFFKNPKNYFAMKQENLA